MAVKAPHQLDATGMLRNGKVDWDDASAVVAELKEMTDGPVLVRIERASETAIRSAQANRYYRRALGLIAKETDNDPNELHDFYLEEFLKKKLFLTNRHTGEVVEREIAQRSKSLSPDDFGHYVDLVIKHAAEFFGVIVPPADPSLRRGSRNAA